MTVLAERTTYIGSDLKLYDSATAGACLPSHEFVVNHGVECKFTFIIKNDCNDTFDANEPIKWSPSRPGHFTAPILENGNKTVSFHDQNTAAETGEQIASFTLQLASGSKLSTCFMRDDVPVDPTIIDKGDEGWGC